MQLTTFGVCFLGAYTPADALLESTVHLAHYCGDRSVFWRCFSRIGCHWLQKPGPKESERGAAEPASFLGKLPTNPRPRWRASPRRDRSAAALLSCHRAFRARHLFCLSFHFREKNRRRASRLSGALWCARKECHFVTANVSSGKRAGCALAHPYGEGSRHDCMDAESACARGRRLHSIGLSLTFLAA